MKLQAAGIKITAGMELSLTRISISAISAGCRYQNHSRNGVKLDENFHLNAYQHKFSYLSILRKLHLLCD